MSTQVTTTDVTNVTNDEDKPVDQIVSPSKDIDKLNEFKIVCKKCSCVILRPNQGKLISLKVCIQIISCLLKPIVFKLIFFFFLS